MLRNLFSAVIDAASRPDAYSEADGSGWFVTYTLTSKPLEGGGKESGTLMAKAFGEGWIFRKPTAEELGWAEQLTRVM